MKPPRISTIHLLRKVSFHLFILYKQDQNVYLSNFSKWKKSLSHYNLSEFQLDQKFT